MAGQHISDEDLAAAFLAKAVGTRLSEVDAAHVYKGTHTANRLNPKDFLRLDPNSGHGRPAVRDLRDPNMVQQPRATHIGREPAGMAPMPDLIPLPPDLQARIDSAGIQLPYTQPVASAVPVVPVITPAPNVAPSPQIEFDFDVTGAGDDVPKNMKELYRYLEDRFTQIDIRMDNMFKMIKTVLPKRRVSSKKNDNA